MISYHKSLEILKDVAGLAAELPLEQVELLQSVGRVLAEDIFARENNPPFDNSAMDGFALHAATAAEAFRSSNEWIAVQTLISAGDANFQIERLGDAIEIMTGAPIPNPHFDTVIRVEDVDVQKDSTGKKWIRLRSAPLKGDNIRRAGEDTKINDQFLRTGDLITKEHLLPLATQGISKLKVRARIKVAILSTGKEIVDHRTPDLQSGQIRNSTGVYLQAAFTIPCCEVKNFGIVSDEPQKYEEIIGTILAEGYDVVVSTGAVSMGVHDFVGASLRRLGAEIHFHKCAIRPGKPILFSSMKVDRKMRFIFGVPGNPVSTAVGVQFFIRPFIEYLLRQNPRDRQVASLATDTKKPEGLTCFFKARLTISQGEARVESMTGQASFMVSPLLRSNAWVVLPEEGSMVKQGTQVEVFDL